MYLYDDPTVTASLPASTGEGTPGYFTDGNPAGGQAATILRAEFMNMLMMELVNAITGAGIPLSKSTFTQLKSAIEAYITARTATEDRTGVVELATSAETQTGTDALRAVTPAGLSTRTATDSRTGLVELATNAETQTGTDTARAVTPAGLASVALGGSGQSWQSVTDSRVLGTTYTNSTGRTIVAMVTVTAGQGYNIEASATVSGVVVGTAQGYCPHGDEDFCLTLIIPNGATYSVTLTGTGTLSSWSELR